MAGNLKDSAKRNVSRSLWVGAIVSVFAFTPSIAMSSEKFGSEAAANYRKTIISKLHMSRSVQPTAAKRAPSLVNVSYGRSPYVCSASGFGRVGTCVSRKH